MLTFDINGKMLEAIYFGNLQSKVNFDSRLLSGVVMLSFACPCMGSSVQFRLAAESGEPGEPGV